VKTKTHTDALGNPIAVGDFITYAVTSGRSAVLKFGKVVACRLKVDEFFTDRINPKIDAVTVENTWGNGWKMQRCTKASPLGGVQALGVRCIVVIPWNSLPSEAMELLDEAFKVQRVRENVKAAKS
jgi:hypothetical protein